MANAAIHRKITQQFLDAIKKGTVPWYSPFTNFQDINGKTRKAYSLLNQLSLAIEREQNNFSSTVWMTFKQAQSCKLSVVSGSKASHVYFSDTKYYKRSGDEKTQIPLETYLEIKSYNPDSVFSFPVLRAYPVFNLAQLKGAELEKYELKTSKQTTFDSTKPDAFIAAYQQKPKITIGANASYNPSYDRITMPKKTSFRDLKMYYSVLFHELVHSTGSAKRLNRPGVSKANTDYVYDREELIAELGANFLSAENDIERTKAMIENSASYIKGWSDAFENDPKIIWYACSKAQQATAYILNNTKKLVQETEIPQQELQR
jgi:antirestriction protein ArdC